mmetsp:Transcript_27636/g.33598  ORF Transcript_27636/g.33598 Transcript_27636/m.33598 type:complete len:1151 (-) Transcript_27636:98-3550(-)|eukprot:CAMPEP_0172500694 /NCGR_PEP_ID=MMETSP1066-20121228/141973_1 /TAXON_ID=671091 /ORGANISM="Coscinodiscus wailesii, Strain CCMP2513" /LENGTH=1150 /DNA_ID=CAMNT_0013275067 /DNA_START=64 /DNA_END=3516 /DNA_ORIENTATION=+
MSMVVGTIIPTRLGNDGDKTVDVTIDDAATSKESHTIDINEKSTATDGPDDESTAVRENITTNAAAMNDQPTPDKSKDDTASSEEDGSSNNPPHPLSIEKAQLTTSPPPHQHPPSFFTDHKGNLKFVNIVCRHPWKVFSSILLTCLVLTFFLIVVIYRDEDGNPFVLGAAYDLSDERSVTYDSLRLAIDEMEIRRDEYAAGSTAPTTTTKVKAAEIRPQEELSDRTIWIFESETEEGLFATRESIGNMKAAIDLFTSSPDYGKYCRLDYESADEMNNGTGVSRDVDVECMLPLSPLNMYYASEWDVELVGSVISELERGYPQNVLRYNFLGVCVEYDMFCPTFLDDDDFAWAVALNENITRIMDKWDGKGDLNANVSEVTLFAGYMAELNTKRGSIDYGYDKNFNLTNLKSLYSRAQLTWGGPLGAREVSGDYNRSERSDDRDILLKYIANNFLKGMNEIASPGYNPDMNSYYFMGSLILEILLDIVTRDASLVLFSFLFVCIYIRVSLGSWFLAAVGLLEIGLSIPVSWFVFQIIFRIKYFSILNALALFIVAAIGADDIFIFMDAYKQSATPSPEDAYILESLESRMSWVYRRTGSAMAITSATTCLAFLCTLLTPLGNVRAFGIFAALVIFVDYVLVMTLFCTAVVIYHNKFEKDGCCCNCCVGGCCKTIDPSPTAIALQNITSGNGVVGVSRISKFFGTKVSAFVLSPYGRLLIAVISVSWLVFASIYSAKLKPSQNAEEFLDDEHPLQKSFTILNNEFNRVEDDPSLNVYFTWGLGGVDREGVNMLTEPDFFGTPIFLDTFNLNQQCQLDMVKACDELKTNKSYTPFIKQEDGLGTVKCFMEEFGAFSALGSLDSCEGVTNGAWKETNWTVPPAKFASFMTDFLAQKSCLSDRNITILSYYEDEIGWDGTQLKFAGISLESSVLDRFSTRSELVAREQYDAMIQISENFDATMKNSCGSEVIMTDLDEKFTFMNNQRIFVESAISSSLLGIAIAFVVLFISTRLFHIALLATLSIACVLISVIAIMAMIGWELGSTEGILISVVAGFSVDYVVHLAHSYERTAGDTAERIKKSFWEMGISVMNGMATSVGASIPLFFCQLQFFAKFGTFLCTILVFSWLFANFAFMAVLAQLKIPIAEKRRLCGV